MVRIAGRTLPGYVTYLSGVQDADIELLVPYEAGLTSDDIAAIQSAETLEEFALNHGEVGETIGVYHLYTWQSVGKNAGGYRFRWQTYRTTDINQLKQDNEDLTQAVLELAQIVGGDSNG